MGICDMDFWQARKRGIFEVGFAPYGTCDMESEAGIKPVSHMGIILCSFFAFYIIKRHKI